MECKYCWEYKSTSKAIKDNKELLTGYIEFGLLGGLDFGAYITSRNTLECTVINESIASFCKKEIPISFCPMCGRKLSGG